MNETELQDQIDDATFDFSMGESTSAIEKLNKVVKTAPNSAAAWHALSEVHLAEKQFKDALAAAEKAHDLNNDDLFINTTLSRIWVALGDKEMAEKYGAAAKVLGWKDQLKNPQSDDEMEVS